MAATRSTLPTGYESQLSQIERRRKLADAMMANGLQGSGPNAQSIFQGLAPVLQAFLAAKMNRGADRQQAEINSGMRGDYARASSAMSEGLKALHPGDRAGLIDLIAKSAGNPWTQDRAGSLEDVLQAKLTDDQKLVERGGMNVLQGNIHPGSLVPGKPTDSEIAVPDGHGGVRWTINPVAMQRAQEAQGIAMPHTEAFRSMPSPYANQSIGASNLIGEELARRAGPGIPPPLGPGQFPPEQGGLPPQMPINSSQRPPDGLTDEGKPYWNVNGIAFDNPEGR